MRSPLENENIRNVSAHLLTFENCCGFVEAKSTNERITYTKTVVAKFVVGQGPFLHPLYFTRARASKWAKVAILPRPDALNPVTYENNNIIYRIYNAAINHQQGGTLRRRLSLPLRGRKVCLANTLLPPKTQPSRPIT